MGFTDDAALAVFKENLRADAHTLEAFDLDNETVDSDNFTGQIVGLDEFLEEGIVKHGRESPGTNRCCS